MYFLTICNVDTGENQLCAVGFATTDEASHALEHYTSMNAEERIALLNKSHDKEIVHWDPPFAVDKPYHRATVIHI